MGRYPDDEYDDRMKTGNSQSVESDVISPAFLGQVKRKPPMKLRSSELYFAKLANKGIRIAYVIFVYARHSRRRDDSRLSVHCSFMQSHYCPVKTRRESVGWS